MHGMTGYTMPGEHKAGNIMTAAHTPANPHKTSVGSFRSYFISAIRFHLRNLYRDYVLKNYIRIDGYEDYWGNTYEILAVAEFANRYRERHREDCRRYLERKRERERAERERLGIPEPEPKIKLTEEERLARRRARSLAYYHAHADEINKRARERRERLRVGSNLTT